MAAGNASTNIIVASKTDWKALYYFNLYRIILAGFFVVLVLAGNLPDPLGEHDQTLFKLVVYIYLAYVIAAAYVINNHILPYQIQLATHVILDMVFLGLMMYASGGLKSGFGILLVITVASGSILSARQIAILFAAIAAIIMLGHEAYIQLFRTIPDPNYTLAAFHGITFFITSIAGHIVSSRLKSSEALAEERARDIQSLASLNDQIVQRMQSGIVAINLNDEIELMNEAARQILGCEQVSNGEKLSAVSAELLQCLHDWQADKQLYSREIHAEGSNTDIKVGFVEVGDPGKKNSLIFLDDLTRMRQQAQSLKLASLGRLSASIAHEIRNPLGAISHAGQLLEESSALTEDDDRLTEIIREQSVRINQIIENVMSMSRREAPLIQEINLEDWFGGFIEEVVEVMNIPPDKIRFSSEKEALSVQVDASQLHQILWNLTQNASRYSQGQCIVAYECGLKTGTSRIYIDVIDTGTGMDPDKEEHLFEPFYTTEKKGSGLGLYIARELCEMNRATLNLLENSKQGCRFRIQFAPQTS